MFFLLLGLLLVAQDPTGSPSAQVILRVPQDYPTIQAAVDAAPEGATILIGPGTYTENIVITKSLTLEGSGIDNTILRPPVPPLENPVLTVQAPGRAVTLHVRQLAVRSQAQLYGGYEGMGIRVLTDASLTLERSAWMHLIGVISVAGPLQRLEIRDSLFEHNYAFISVVHEEEFVIDEVILERNRFTRGANASIYERIWIVGRRLIAHDNTVICDPELPPRLVAPQLEAGMALGVIEEGGQAEIARNSVALCEEGIVVAQGVREARVTIRDNWFFNNNHNLVIESLPNYLTEGEVIHPRLDWLIEGNTIVGGGIGIKTGIIDVEGGQARLFKNWIARQRKQYVGIITPPDIFLFGNGILLGTSLRRESLKEPLQIEISENRIEGNEAWGLALNLLPGEDDRPDQCNLKAPGEEQVFVDPEISGSGNVFRDNGKGDLCPPDYPWPPGFRK
jgi:hypothetical protein